MPKPANFFENFKLVSKQLLWFNQKIKMDTLGSVDGRTKAVIESASSEQFASEATYEEYINQLWCFFSFLLTSRLMHLFNFLKPLMLRSGLLRWNWFQNSENLFILN